MTQAWTSGHQTTIRGGVVAKMASGGLTVVQAIDQRRHKWWAKRLVATVNDRGQGWTRVEQTTLWRYCHRRRRRAAIKIVWGLKVKGLGRVILVRRVFAR